MAPVSRNRRVTTIAAQVPADLRDRLEAIAQADDRKLSYVIRRALIDYVEVHEANGEAEGGKAS